MVLTPCNAEDTAGKGPATRRPGTLARKKVPVPSTTRQSRFRQPKHMRPKLALALFATSLAACGGGGTDSPSEPAVDSVSVASVIVTPSSPTITVGATQTFAAT